jgi:L-ascorbate metabolism protein UlaG (beta-lactamase superfamily)
VTADGRHPEALRAEGSRAFGTESLAALGMTIAMFAVAASASAPAPAALQAQFIGNMAFAITDGKTVLYTDFPYESGAFGYMSYDMASVPKAPGSLFLLTHGHKDHFDASLLAKMDGKVIAPPKLEATLPAARVIPYAPKMTYRDITVEAFPTPHGDINHASYLVTWHGLRLYFTGDTESTDQLLAMKDLDYAFVSPWLLGTVAQKKSRIDARTVICYHHKADDKKIPEVQGRVVPKQGAVLMLQAAPADSAGAPR